MSMLSAQCDELRAMAASVELEVPQAATLMMGAADTILSLRDRAQDLHAHNAKLRKERDMYRDLVGYMVHPDIPDQLAAENTKLRELVRDMFYAMHPVDREKFLTNVVELGVEVRA